jgi:hypothetical protein
MDADAEYLTFNLGIVIELDSRGWIQVIRVSSDVDENEQVSGLRTEGLACFREEHLDDCLSSTIRGRYVAYSMYPCGSIIIVDWTLADSTSLVYPRRIIGDRRAEVSSLSFFPSRSQSVLVVGPVA